MGKARIKRHLGDAHYEIALDIDVAYAKKALDAHTAYLAEFEPKLQTQKDARDAAKTEFDAAGVALQDYLTPKREASEAAYAVMDQAYQSWLSAVNAAQEPALAAANLKAMQDAAKAWLDAEDAMIYALANDYFVVDPAPVYPPAVALRNTRLLESQAADGAWENSRGDMLDSNAVTTARDAKLLAYGNLDLALTELVDAYVAWYNSSGPLPDPEASAYDIARQSYETQRTDWVSAVQNNTGSSLINARKKAYDDAKSAFETAQKDMAATLEDGSVPPGLLEKWQAMTEAEVRWRTADLEYRDMLLIKTEREKQATELRTKLRTFYDPDDQPIDQIIHAWCADASEELAAETTVATIEIPGERDLGVRVRPGYENRYAYTPSRDGKLQPSWASSPEAMFYNWAVHPGAQKWRPNYRLGKITALDADANTCTVELDAQKNSEKSKARDGSTLDVNNPVKVQVLPKPPAGPGGTEDTYPENVAYADGKTTLKNVRIEYMECNADAFATDDHVIVEFTNFDWTTPKVIGFAEQPKPCLKHGILCTAKPNHGASENVLFGRTTAIRSRHITESKTGGHCDWVSSDGKTVLSWHGPLGRSIAPRVIPFATGEFNSGKWPATFGLYNATFAMVKENVGYNTAYAQFTRFTSAVYRDGSVYATAPSGKHVLGAAIFTTTGQDEHGAAITVDWLVIAASSAFVYPNVIDNATATGPSIEIMAAKTTALSTWTTLATQTFTVGAISGLPPINIVAFAPDGGEFVSLIPAVTADAGNNTYRLINDLIYSGSITGTTDALTATGTVTLQAAVTIAAGDNSSLISTGSSNYTRNYDFTASSHYTATGVIIAADFDHETGDIVHLFADYTYARDYAQHSVETGTTTNGILRHQEKGETLLETITDTLTITTADATIIGGHDLSYTQTWNHSGTATQEFVNDNGNVYWDMTQRDMLASYSTTKSINANTLIFADLRCGGYIRLDMASTFTETKTDTTAGLIVPANITRTRSSACEQVTGLSSTHGNLMAGLTQSWAYDYTGAVYGAELGGDVLWAGPGFFPSTGVNQVYSNAYTNLAFSVNQTARQPFLWTEYADRYWDMTDWHNLTPLQPHAASAPDQDLTLLSFDQLFFARDTMLSFAASPDSLYGDDLPTDRVRGDHTGSYGADHPDLTGQLKQVICAQDGINTVWRAHLESKHAKTKDDPPVWDGSTTAAEDDLTPEFRL